MCPSYPSANSVRMERVPAEGAIVMRSTGYSPESESQRMWGILDKTMVSPGSSPFNGEVPDVLAGKDF